MKLEIPSDCCALARKLIAEGTSPDEVLEFYRGEELCLSGKASTFAALTVREDSKEGPVHVKWKPFPTARMRPQSA